MRAGGRQGRAAGAAAGVEISQRGGAGMAGGGCAGQCEQACLVAQAGGAAAVARNKWRHARRNGPVATVPGHTAAAATATAVHVGGVAAEAAAVALPVAPRGARRFFTVARHGAQRAACAAQQAGRRGGGAQAAVEGMR
eukprot:356929-Chlamydomonas_euryale.AAC.2